MQSCKRSKIYDEIRKKKNPPESTHLRPLVLDDCLALGFALEYNISA